MNIRLIAIDLDDTLLREDLTISETNRKALAEAEERGVAIVLASGRSPLAMRPYVKALGLDKREGYLITFNGSSLRRADTGEEEWGVRLGAEIGAEVWDTCEQHGWPVQTYTDSDTIASAHTEFTLMDSKLTGVPLRIVGREEFLAADPIKILMPNDPEVLKAPEAMLGEQLKGRVNIFRSKPYYLEIMHAAADKGLALRRLAAIHGIDREEVMAIGDAMNDEGMMRWAGLPIAPANAMPGIKSLARWVTSRTHQHDAVAEAVEKYVLNPKT